MSHCAEFQIIGRIGQIKTVGTTLRVTIAAAYPYKDDRGEWQERTRWNEITVFNDARQSYVQRNLKSGDLIRATGVLEQTSWEKNGETHYGVTLACEQIGRLAKGPGHAAGADDSHSDERPGRRKPPRPTSRRRDASRPAPPTNRSPFGGLHGRFPETEGPHAGGTRGSGRRPQSPRPPIDCLKV